MVCGVIVAGLEVIEPSLRIVVIPAVAQGVGACHASGLRKNVAPCVVGIADRIRSRTAVSRGDKLVLLVIAVGHGRSTRRTVCRLLLLRGCLDITESIVGVVVRRL